MPFKSEAGVFFSAFTDEMVKISGLLEHVQNLGPVGKAAVTGVVVGGLLGGFSGARGTNVVFDPNTGERPATAVERGVGTIKGGLKGALLGGVGGGLLGLAARK
ncbi:MAG: hypothetical protein LUQ37_03645 [Methanoregulaceae archaeon]|jgi:hypothetical protein|nr:hypothetical protein [Methanoregulaceae archaeon]